MDKNKIVPGSSVRLPPQTLTFIEEAKRRAIEMMHTNGTLQEVLSSLALSAQAYMGEKAVASIMLLNQSGELHHIAAPDLPDEYQRALNGIKAQPHIGACCAAAATGEPVSTPDIAMSANWDGFRYLPLSLGLLAAWSNPIKGREGDVLGTFGVYFRERRQPLPQEIAAVEALSRIASLAIEREKD